MNRRGGRQNDRDPRNGRLRMSGPRALVKHFFRHEFGRLCAVLTRSLGVRRLDLVEDVVQAALVQALETWSRRGVLKIRPGGFTAPPATWRCRPRALGRRSFGKRFPPVIPVGTRSSAHDASRRNSPPKAYAY